MGVDRERALEAFREYVAAYDPSNPRIALKIDHTMHVARLCERIALSEGCSNDDADLAWLLGLLHDIGRFEQVRRYDTYNDAASVSHASLGAQILFEGCRDDGLPGSDGDGEPGACSSGDGEGVALPTCDGLQAGGSELSDVPRQAEPLVRAFIADDGFDELIRVAVATHSDFRLPEDLDERTLFFCNVVRDADKIDILRANCAFTVSEIYGVSEERMAASPLSPECVELFYQHSCLPRGVRRHPADILLGHVCLAWELVFPESRRIMREQGHLRQMLQREWTNEQTRATFAAMARHMFAE